MSTTPEDPTTQPQIWIDPELRDEIRDAWRSACQLADSAYRTWSQAAGESRVEAYVVYAAHLDQEEAAAQHLRSSIQAPPAPAETATCAPVAPTTGRGDGERSEAVRLAICVAPLWDPRWARLLTIGVRPNHGDPSTARPQFGDPSRRQEST
jgi:hypothetical protein